MTVLVDSERAEALYWGLAVVAALARRLGFDEQRFLNLVRMTWRIGVMQETSKETETRPA